MASRFARSDVAELDISMDDARFSDLRTGFCVGDGGSAVASWMSAPASPPSSAQNATCLAARNARH